VNNQRSAATVQAGVTWQWWWRWEWWPLPEFVPRSVWWFWHSHQNHFGGWGSSQAQTPTEWGAHIAHRPFHYKGTRLLCGMWGGALQPKGKGEMKVRSLNPTFEHLLQSMDHNKWFAVKKKTRVIATVILNFNRDWRSKEANVNHKFSVTMLIFLQFLLPYSVAIVRGIFTTELKQKSY